MKQTFYSNGKLLITGEYLVLDGAKAFALPTKFGQFLDIKQGENQEIHWRSRDSDGSIWFEEIIAFSEITNPKVDTNDESVKLTLIRILKQAFITNPDFLLNSNGYRIETRLTFPKLWGLGTSSTLINNIAQWLKIDAFLLLKNSFGGSGYDIACAQNDSPILYQLVEGNPKVEKILFEPEYKNQLYFVYLNKKQSSKKAIASYYNKSSNTASRITEISKITEAVRNSIDSDTFESELREHEKQMSEILELNTIQQDLFSDFDGFVKSLGAWGGDFVMVLSKYNPKEYFKEKGYDTLIPYSKMIL